MQAFGYSMLGIAIADIDCYSNSSQTAIAIKIIDNTSISVTNTFLVLPAYHNRQNRSIGPRIITQGRKAKVIKGGLCPVVPYS